MASRNLRTPKDNFKTYEGAKAMRLTPEQRLRRSVMSCLLWEKEFYEDGEKAADRILELIPQVDPETVGAMAIEARTEMNLRHVPLLLIIGMIKTPSHRKHVARTIAAVISRPDELSELLTLYFDGKKKPLAAQLKAGLAAAFTKFNAYQLAKWDKPKEIRLKDVMFLCHPKPKDDEQAKTFKQLASGTLPTPDTWEVALSTGAESKKDSWTRLLKEKKLGAMALLRNLRNMEEANVERSLVREAVATISDNRVLPFRYIAAARYVPQLENVLEQGMLNGLSTHRKLYGKTVLLVDVSGSMDQKLSAKSDINRLDAACGLAMLLREICEDVEIYTFSLKLVQIAPRRGFALRDAIVNSQAHSGTYLGASVNAVYAEKGTSDRFKGYYSGHLTFKGQGLRPDRLIAITDEQSNDQVPSPNGVGYMLNVASNKNGVGYGPWTHVDGFSESVIRFVQELEDNNY